jgi:5-methylcytosine-specific restriction endonuclease McrA
MTLSKLEVQQMLREMNVKFSADETLESLKQRLQKENHSLWLKSVSGSRTTDGKSEKVVVRKRKKDAAPQAAETAAQAPPRKANAFKKTVNPRDPAWSGRPEPAYPPSSIEKPSPGKPWKAAADGTEPFNRKKNVFESVLRRARKCCEHCGTPSDSASGSGSLEPFHIVPLSQGGEHSIKNVVALCPTCMTAMQNDPSPKAIKDLKRKTRSRLYDSLQVVRKTTVRSRRRHPGRPK